MAPAHPPFPTASYFPFQFAGIQISTLISESAVGMRVAATRQNEGSFFRTPAAGLTPGALNWSGRRLSGRVNSPADTDCARVIEVSGNESFESPSQEDGTALTILGRNSTVQNATAIPALGGCSIR